MPGDIKTKQLYDYHVKSGQSLGSYDGPLSDLILADGRPVKHQPASVRPVDNIYTFPATSKGGGRWENMPDESLMAWRFPTLQAALDAGAALGCPVRLRPYEVVTLPPEGISIDVTMTALLGFSSEIIWIYGTGRAVHYTGPGRGEYPPYMQSWTAMSGIYLKNTFGDTSTAVGLDCSAIGEPGPSHTKVRNCTIQGFDVNVRLGANSYALTFENCDIWFANSYCVVGANEDNCGEEWRFINCTLFNSNKIFSMKNPNGTLRFIGCSGDYNKGYGEVEDGVVYWQNGHLEGANMSGYVCTISGTGRLYLDANRRACTGFDVKPTAYFHVLTTVGQGGGVWETNSFISTCFTTSGYQADGPGNYYPKNNSGYDITQNALLSSLTNNRFIDGSFTKAAAALATAQAANAGATFTEDMILDDFLVTGTAARSNRLAAPNAVASLSTFGGSPALKFEKVGGPGSLSTLRVFLSTDRGEPAPFIYYLSKPGSETGTLYLSFFHVGGRYTDANGYIDYRQKELIGTEVLTVTAAPIVHHGHAEGEPCKRMPGWSTGKVLEINAFSMNPCTIYLQDFCMT